MSNEIIYKYGGAKALVALHEIHLRSFYKHGKRQSKSE